MTSSSVSLSPALSASTCQPLVSSLQCRLEMLMWEFDWDEENEENLQLHAVTLEEVEQCFFNRHL